MGTGFLTRVHGQTRFLDTPLMADEILSVYMMIRTQIEFFNTIGHNQNQTFLGDVFPLFTPGLRENRC